MSQAIATAGAATSTNMETTTSSRRIYNPVQKDAVTFLQTAEESGGVRTLIELEVASGGGNMLHYHKTFDEHFTAVSGEVGVQIGKETFTLKPGESAIAPAMSLHRWYNLTAETAIVRVELLPGSAAFERGLHIGYGLAHDGFVNKQGVASNTVHL